MKLFGCVVLATVLLALVADVSASGSKPCPNPVCKPVCVKACKTSTLSCSNSTTTTTVCNFECAVPEAPKVIVTPIPFDPSLGRRRLSGKSSAVTFKTVSGGSGGGKGGEYGWAPVTKPAPVTPPPSPAPVPVCSQSCSNVTGWTFTCTPRACTKLVDKKREVTNCTIQCSTPSGRKLMGDEAAYTYTPVSYKDVPGAAPVPSGSSTPICQQICVISKETYQDVDCVSEACTTTDCSGPEECTCPSPEPAPAPEKKKKLDIDVPGLIEDIVAALPTGR